MSMEIKPLPDLPDSDRARDILERLRREFLPIAKARGYEVTSLSEMCCCGDAGRRNHGRGRGGRLMSNSVWGYNQSHGRGGTKSCRISVRLRQPTLARHGTLLPYEHAAGTMAHELAHCVHGDHSAAFYRLMDEIADQHADYVARGLVVDRDGFPVGGESHVLGGRGAGAGAVRSTIGGGGNLREAVRRAAEERSRRPAPTKPQKLGTANAAVSGGIGGIDPKLPPREAARLAAERRALLDAKWCLPCNQVIDMLSDDDDDDVVDDGSSDSADTGKKIAAASKGIKGGANDEDITDLTASADKKTSGDNTRKRAGASDNFTEPIDLTESPVRRPRRIKKSSSVPSAAAAAAAAATGTTSVLQESNRAWACTACTLQNRPEALACDACGKARWNNGDESAAAADVAMRRDEAIAVVRENEVRQSEDAFGGFNIYGSKKRETGTLPHLT